MINKYAATGKNGNSFVGIKIKNDRIDFYYPESYCISTINDKRAFRNDVIAILKSLSLAKTHSDKRDKTRSSFYNENSPAIMSYLWIINDYLSNGIYVNREKETKKNQHGKINWSKTLKTEPIISNNSLIFKDFIVETKSEYDNVIVAAYRYCVKQSIKMVGWLFSGLNQNIIECFPFNKTVKKLYVVALKKELDKTFDDLKKIRLTHMLKIIEGINEDENTEELIYGVDNYEYVFERMINQIFGNQKSLEKFEPKANWYLLHNNFKKEPSSKMRPDTVLIQNDTAYILDSKYYRFGITGKSEDLPETTSIQKQITYGDYIKNNHSLKISNIRNGFILPYNKNNNPFYSSETIHYVGYSLAESKQNQIEDYNAVHAFLIDLKFVVNNWYEYSHKNETKNLIEKIEKAVKEKNNTR